MGGLDDATARRLALLVLKLCAACTFAGAMVGFLVGRFSPL